MNVPNYLRSQIQIADRILTKTKKLNIANEAKNHMFPFQTGRMPMLNFKFLAIPGEGELHLPFDIIPGCEELLIFTNREEPEMKSNG